MLVLSRRPGQKIVIGNEIIIEILTVSGEGVRVGISAPNETSIHRYEVFTEIEAANRSAQVASDDIEISALGDLSELVRTKQNS